MLLPGSDWQRFVTKHSFNSATRSFSQTCRQSICSCSYFHRWWARFSRICPFNLALGLHLQKLRRCVKLYLPEGQPSMEERKYIKTFVSLDIQGLGLTTSFVLSQECSLGTWTDYESMLFEVLDLLYWSSPVPKLHHVTTQGPYCFMSLCYCPGYNFVRRGRDKKTKMRISVKLDWSAGKEVCIRIKGEPSKDFGKGGDSIQNIRGKRMQAKKVWNETYG